jgi:hypothetical protein
MKELLDDYSIREKNLWFQLFVDIAVALYYWPQALRLMAAGDLSGGAMVGLITGTVITAIVVSAVLSIFLHMQQKPEPMDERDYMIEARSSLLASRVLVVCVFIIIGHVVMQELAPPAPELGIGPLNYFSLFSPLMMAHMLLIALMLWSFAGSLARLYFYRRGL